MLRLGFSTQAAHAQRHLRPQYAHHQATAYAAFLSDVINDGTTPFVKGGGAVPGTAGQGPIMPGMVAGWSATGEQVWVHTGGTTYRIAGLFGTYVGGDFDESFDMSEVPVWMGPGSTWEILTPVFNANNTAADEATGAARELFPDANGLLNDSAVGGTTQVCALLLDWVSAAKIVVELLV